jgi:hypothetical protein
MKYLILGGLCAIIGLLAGVYYVIVFMSPPRPVEIGGHIYQPCGLAIFPMMAEGGAIGFIVGGCSLFAARLLPSRTRSI